jgi:diguanylate cyclase (GGDEF)-like protein
MYLRETQTDKMICKHLEAEGIDRYVCIPMMAQGESLGILHVQHGEVTTLSDEAGHKQQLLTTVTEHFAMALANLRLRETLKNQSIRDPLTGLFNRRYMETTLERELRRAARNKLPMSLMMLDLDHFKHFNDTFGHDAGDLLLREVASCLRGAVRAEDIVCRYGGEEFTIVLLEADAAQTRLRAENICAAVKQLRVQYRGQPLGPITTSVGVALFPEHSSVVNDLLGFADKALYQAKSEGRNRVVTYVDPKLAVTSANQSAVGSHAS